MTSHVVVRLAEMMLSTDKYIAAAHGAVNDAMTE
jgi:hypothetical protein